MESIIIGFLAIWIAMMITFCIIQYYQIKNLKVRIKDQDYLISFFEKKLFEEMDRRIKKGGVI